jgi:hypothetical protein
MVLPCTRRHTKRKEQQKGKRKYCGIIEDTGGFSSIDSYETEKSQEKRNACKQQDRELSTPGTHTITYLQRVTSTQNKMKFK